MRYFLVQRVRTYDFFEYHVQVEYAISAGTGNDDGVFTLMPDIGELKAHHSINKREKYIYKECLMNRYVISALRVLVQTISGW